ncbi:helicase, partial [Achromatium sp. WMS2]
MSALRKLLTTLRHQAANMREQGTYFEQLTLIYLQHEPYYQNLYAQVWTYPDWARTQGLDARDVGIDLVAQTRGDQKLHAIQCKFYAADYKLQKSDIDSFFTASGKTDFSQRLIVSTTDNWS